MYVLQQQQQQLLQLVKEQSFLYKARLSAEQKRESNCTATTTTARSQSRGQLV